MSLHTITIESPHVFVPKLHVLYLRYLIYTYLYIYDNDMHVHIYIWRGTYMGTYMSSSPHLYLENLDQGLHLADANTEEQSREAESLL